MRTLTTITLSRSGSDGRRRSRKGKADEDSTPPSTNAYQILGVPSTANQKEIDATFATAVSQSDLPLPLALGIGFVDWSAIVGSLDKGSQPARRLCLQSRSSTGGSLHATDRDGSIRDIEEA